VCSGISLGWLANSLILGYWRLINMGILHRDISSGNVMMLRPGQTFTRREWKENGAAEHKIQDEALVESEKKLQEVLAKLNRDPTGLLSDFDLHTTHSTAASHFTSIRHIVPTDEDYQGNIDDCEISSSSSSASMTSTEEAARMPRHGKRRKTNTHSSVSVQTSKSRISICRQSGESSSGCRDRASQAEGAHRVIDYRTVSFSVRLRFLLQFSECCLVRLGYTCVHV
jgi:hypothetical protein